MGCQGHETMLDHPDRDRLQIHDTPRDEKLLSEAGPCRNTANGLDAECRYFLHNSRPAGLVRKPERQ